MRPRVSESISGGWLWAKSHPISAVVVAAVCIAILGAFAAGWFLFYDLRVNQPKRIAIQKQMENEFGQLRSPPNSRSLRYSSSRKGNQGEVGSDYLSSLGYEQLRTFYDSELKNTGWRFVKEEPVKTWGQSHGGKQAFYCKGPYTATLEYAGEAENQMGWTYSFGLSWGLFDECK